MSRWATTSVVTYIEFEVSLWSSLVTNQVITCTAGFLSDLAKCFSELTYTPHKLYSVADLQKFTSTDPREDFTDHDVGTWGCDPLALDYNASDVRDFNVWEDKTKINEEGGDTGICKNLNLSAMVIPTEYAASWASGSGLSAVSVLLGAHSDGTPIQAGLRELLAVAPGIPFGLTLLGAKMTTLNPDF
jgi:amidase